MPELEPEELSLLESRFASFAAVPAVALPGAGAARERGRQRTRRTRAALGGALAAVLVLSAGVGAGSDGGGRDRVVPGPAHSGPPEVGLQGALLDPDDVAAVRAGEWSLRPTEDLPFPVPHEGCDGRGPLVVAPVETAVRFLDGPQVIGHQLAAYAEESQAAGLLDLLRDELLACREGYVTYDLNTGLPGTSASRFYARRLDPAGDVLFAVERIGTVLSTVALQEGAWRDLPALADAAAEEVRGGPGPEPASSPPRTSGLLTREDVATIEPGTWTALPWTGEEDLLSPCGREAAPVPVDVAGTDLRLERETGGTFVYQQVFRFASEQLAAQALADRRDAVEACPQEPVTRQPEPDPGMRGAISYDVIETGQVPFVVRVSTQCETCQPQYSYRAVVQVGARLAVLAVGGTRGGDPGAGLVIEYARVAAERLRADAD